MKTKSWNHPSPTTRRRQQVPAYLKAGDAQQAAAPVVHHSFHSFPYGISIHSAAVKTPLPKHPRSQERRTSAVVVEEGREDVEEEEHDRYYYTSSNRDQAQRRQAPKEQQRTRESSRTKHTTATRRSSRKETQERTSSFSSRRPDHRDTPATTSSRRLQDSSSSSKSPRSSNANVAATPKAVPISNQHRAPSFVAQQKQFFEQQAKLQQQQQPKEKPPLPIQYQPRPRSTTAVRQSMPSFETIKHLPAHMKATAIKVLPTGPNQDFEEEEEEEDEEDVFVVQDKKALSHNDPTADAATHFTEAIEQASTRVDAQRKWDTLQKWGIPVPFYSYNNSNNPARNPEMILLDRLVWVKYQRVYWWPALLYHHPLELQQAPNLWNNLSCWSSWKWSSSGTSSQYPIARLLGRPKLELIRVVEPTSDISPFPMLLPKLLKFACHSHPFRKHPSFYYDWHSGLDQVEGLLQDFLGRDFCLVEKGQRRKRKWLEKAQLAEQARWQAQHPTLHSWWNCTWSNDLELPPAAHLNDTNEGMMGIE